MTGLEIIALKEDQAILFKVRHDGYAIEDYINLKKQPNAASVTDAIADFKKWFFNPNLYGPEDTSESGSDIDTAFPTGYIFVPKTTDFESMLNQAENELSDLENNQKLPNGSKFEGMLCGYSDYQVLIDLNNNSFNLI